MRLRRRPGARLPVVPAWVRRIPLSPAGWMVGLGAALCGLLGWALGWLELTVVSVGAAVALLAGIWHVMRRYRLEISRVIDPDRVEVGDPSSGVLTVANVGRGPALPVAAHEMVGGRFERLDIPLLAPGATNDIEYPLPTHRRAVLEIGPMLIVRQDPLMLFRTEVRHSATSTLWVHPRHVVLRPPAAGWAKDLEGPTSESSPRGDVAFHALRDYVHGDDHRHIHWKSSARTGRLMVREYVDNRLPSHLVVLDSSWQSYTHDDDFELAVEVVASLGVSAHFHGQPYKIVTRGELLASAGLTPSSRDLLDRLAGVEAGDDTDDDDLVLASAARRFSGTSVMVYVTGPLPADTLLARVSAVGRRHRTAVVRCGPSGLPVALSRARVMDATELRHFEAAWNRWVS